MVTNSLNVALFTEATGGGVGRHVVDLAAALRGNGHSVHLLFSKRRADETFLGAIGRLTEQGVVAKQIDVQHGPHPTDLRAILALRQYLREFGPFDVLHCHSTKAGLIGRLAALGSPTASIYSPHAFLTMCPSIRPLRRTLTAALEQILSVPSAAVICVSNEEKQHAQRLRLASRKLFIVQNGIDIEATAALRSQRQVLRNRFGLADDEICVGFVGRLVAQKAPQLLLAAFAEARRLAKFKCRLVLVGDGPLLASLKQRASQLAISEHVVFAGSMNGPLAMTAFDLFALPSQYEGFPYVALEALAIALPIVTTETGGSSAFVRPQNGFTVAVDSTRAFASALLKLIDDAQLRRSMALAAKDLSQTFDLGRMQLETVAVYEHVLRQRKTSADKRFKQPTVGDAPTSRAASLEEVSH